MGNCCKGFSRVVQRLVGKYGFRTVLTGPFLTHGLHNPPLLFFNSASEGSKPSKTLLGHERHEPFGSGLSSSWKLKTCDVFIENTLLTSYYISTIFPLSPCQSREVKTSQQHYYYIRQYYIVLSYTILYCTILHYIKGPPHWTPHTAGTRLRRWPDWK